MPGRILLTFVVLCLLTARALAGGPELVFTAIPDEDETRLQARFSKVAEYLQTSLSVPVRFVPVKSYAASVTAFANNQVQLAWFGGLSGLRARDMVPGSQAIAQGVEDLDFFVYFIANTATGLERSAELPDALRGMTLTFGSRGSTSGRLMPEHYLRERFGEKPDEVFSRVGYSGNHTRTIALVESGAYQVGAVNYAVWDKMVEEGAVDTERVRVIWQSPSFPDYQWSIRGDVDERFGRGFIDKVTRALQDMDDPDLLASFPRSGFVPASNDQYELLRQVGQQVGVLD